MMIAAIFTTFRPKPDVVDNILAVMGQVAEVIVVDNGSPSSHLDAIRDLSGKEGFSLIENEKNRGIAAALNQGIRLAAEHGCRYVLLLDQDSTATTSMVDLLVEQFEIENIKSSIGMICTRNLSRDSGVWCPPLLDESGFPVVTMTSGSLLPVALLMEVGMLEEDLFIEFVDHALCLRLRERGYRILISPNAVLHHDVGFPERHSFFGLVSCTCVHHSARRRYYFARNLVILLRRYRTREPAWFKSEALAFVRSCLKIAAFEDHRLEKIAWTVRGISDALLGRMGNTVQL